LDESTKFPVRKIDDSESDVSLADMFAFVLSSSPESVSFGASRSSIPFLNLVRGSSSNSKSISNGLLSVKMLKADSYKDENASFSPSREAESW